MDEMKHEDIKALNLFRDYNLSVNQVPKFSRILLK